MPQQQLFIFCEIVKVRNNVTFFVAWMDLTPPPKHPSFPCACALQSPDCIAAAAVGGGSRTVVVAASAAAVASSSGVVVVVAAADRLEEVGAC